jgi:hypothetical protein
MTKEEPREAPGFRIISIISIISLISYLTKYAKLQNR